MEALNALGNINYTTCEVVSRNVTVKNATETVSSFSPLLCGVYGLYPSWRPVIVFILLGFILMSILGNGCLVGVIATRESMQEPGNFFLAALAVRDISGSLLLVPLSIHNTAYGTYINGPVCEVQAFLISVLGSLCHSLLMCLWVCRYIHIVYPMKYEEKLSRARIAIAMAVCVLVAVLPPLAGVLRTGSVQVVTYDGTINMKVSRTTVYPCVPDGLEAVAIGVIYLIMMIISNIFAILIFLEAQRHRENLRTNVVSTEAMDSKFKAAKTLGIVLIIYWITWLPMLIIFFLSKSVAISTLSVALDICQIVTLTNTFSDSLVYAFRYEIYRNALIRMFRNIKNAIRDTILDYIEMIRE